LLFDRTALRQSTSEAASETRKPEKRRSKRLNLFVQRQRLVMKR